MPHPSIEEKRQKWKKEILKQIESGQSIAQWCRENKILQHHFFYWKKRLFPEPSLTRSEFVEIAEPKKGRTGGTKITIEYQGIHVSLYGNPDAYVLQQCFTSLKEFSC